MGQRIGFEVLNSHVCTHTRVSLFGGDQFSSVCLMNLGQTIFIIILGIITGDYTSYKTRRKFCGLREMEEHGEEPEGGVE